MQSKATTINAYLKELSEERKDPIEKLRKVILKNLSKGVEENISYGMIAYCVPHSIYPNGYHCDPKQPLPFMMLASQKNFISLYHMGLYANPVLMEWFTQEYAERVKGKLDIGKSCIRFKKPEQIPFDLIGELVAKMSADEWIVCYEKNLQKK